MSTNLTKTDFERQQQYFLFFSSLFFQNNAKRIEQNSRPIPSLLSHCSLRDK